MPSVAGVDDGSGFGVQGLSPGGNGVVGRSYNGNGVWAQTTIGDGVIGFSNSGAGIHGFSNSGAGIHGISSNYLGVFGESNYLAVYGLSNTGTGLYGLSNTGTGVVGYSSAGYAAVLAGRVLITGPLTKPGGSFKIDHPVDPANKYLCHSFVESPDMKNVYDGVVALDEAGEAEIQLPDWFGALNKAFRYQLTAIGSPGPNLFIAEEISDSTATKHDSQYDDYDSGDNGDGSRFKIAGGASGMKVSWQVTGIRKDPWANAHRIQVEEDKPDKERGYYIYPDLYGQPAENGLNHLLFPDREKQELLAHK